MKSDIFVSVVLVTSNQAKKLINYLTELSPYLEQKYNDYEIIIIDQYSTDKTEILLNDALSKYKSIRHIKLTQKVSDDIALAAGIENSIGDLVINLNIEHDDIEMLTTLIENASKGVDICVCVSHKITSTMYKKIRSLFTKLLFSIGYSLPSNSTGTFCFSRRAVNAITATGRFHCKLHMKIANTGYQMRSVNIDTYLHNPQRKSLLDGITESIHYMTFNSTKPLRWMSALGVFGSISAILFSLYSLIIHLIHNQVVPGWTTTILFISSLFTILFIMLSFFGEYLARLLNESKHYQEYNVIYERNSSVMLNIERQNVLFSSLSDETNNNKTGRNK